MHACFGMHALLSEHSNSQSLLQTRLPFENAHWWRLQWHRLGMTAWSLLWNGSSVILRSPLRQLQAGLLLQLDRQQMMPP